MKKNILFTGITVLILIAVLLFWKADTGYSRLGNEKLILNPNNSILQGKKAGFDENVTEDSEIDSYFGSYEITQFLPTSYYSSRKYDVLTDQEADMMLGHVVVIEPDLLVTYDSERALGAREGRNVFSSNYMIEKYILENPELEWTEIASDTLDFFLKPGDDMAWAIGESHFGQLTGIIMIPQLCSPYGTQYYYTLEDENKLVMYSTLTGQYFLLERMDACQEEILTQQLSDEQKEDILTQIFGNYTVAGFLPTKFYPALDSAGYEILPQEEADLMLGQEIVITKELFRTYDNFRMPNSDITNRLEDGYWIEKAEIQNPEYQVEVRLCSDIYGLRDDMLPNELKQREYIAVDVFPGYETNGEKALPQLFLVNDKELLLYSMGEYFLLEKR